jgi:hypothetical protein
MPARWTTATYSRSRVKAAGKALRDSGQHTVEELWEAQRMVVSGAGCTLIR